jgi:hypothetical protein
MFQAGISALIGAKIQTIPRFKGIKQMWVGADYSLANKWQWRGYYKAFTGKLTRAALSVCLSTAVCLSFY